MTNASVKNLLFGLSVVAIAAALSLGAFATNVHAADWDSFGLNEVGGWDSWGYDSGWDSWGSNNGWDSWGYDSGWDSWGNDAGWDSWGYDSGWDSWGNDAGWDSWGYDSGWDSWGYNNDYELYNNDYELYNNDYELYNNDYELYNNDYELYANDYELYDYYGVNDVYKQIYGESFAKSFAPMSIVPPKYSNPSFPSFPNYPSYPPQQPPRPQPPVSQPPVYPPVYPPAPQPPVTNNNCVNNSCNVNTNTNVNTNVTTITQANPQPIVQYIAPQYPVYPQTQAPYCVITIGQGYYTTGMITLTWSSQGSVTSAYITPSVGQVAPNGSTSLYAYGSSVYSLTVSGPGGTYTCHTQSYVAPAAPVSPYVSLTQIPYTGLSLGPIGNIAYWTALFALAIAGAYLLVYYKGGALALATSMVSRGRADEVTEEIAATDEVKASHFELPTTNESMTRDAMQMVRSADGTPRLVISRA